MKKLLSVILAAVMLLGCMSVPAFAEEVDCDHCGGTKIEPSGAEYLLYVRQKIDEAKAIDRAAFEAAFAVDLDSAVQNLSNRFDNYGRDIDYQCNQYLPTYPMDSEVYDKVIKVSECVSELRLQFETVVRNLDIYMGYYENPNDYIYIAQDCFGNIEAAYNDLADAVENLPCSVCLGTGKVTAPEEPVTPESDFLTSFTLNKDYNDKYSTGNKTTAVNETVTYTITPISTGDDVPAFTNSTFTIDVDDGVGSAVVPLPTTITKTGDYWYSIQETGGKTAGVTYDTNTYYLHLITDCKDGEFGVVTAQIHVTAPDLTETDYEDQFVNDASDKIDTVSNSYGEGSLTVGQVTTVNGEASSEDTFTAKVTFTPAEGTDGVGTITYGDGQTVTKNTDGKYVVEVELKGGETVTFTGIPDGVTYTVEQTGGNEDKGYTLDSVVFDVTDETGDTVTDLVASGTIGDLADAVTITNSKTVPIDVGVILENGAFIVLALGAIAAGAWLVISRKRKSVDAE